MATAPVETMPRPTQSAEEKVQVFRDLRVLHPRLIEAEEQIMAALHDCPRNSILYLYGPSGVGKTTLREKVERRILKEAAEELAHNKDKIALVSVEAPSPDAGAFKWREHFKGILQCLDEPLIDLREDRTGSKLAAGMLLAANNNARVAVAAYQTSVTTALRFRQPTALLTDEAQHIAKVASGRRLVDQLDVIKSVANGSNTPHILVGTYELLGLRNLNGQAARRSLEVDFSRYLVNVDEDAKAFRDVIDAFARRLPFDEPPDLLAHWDFLYERSIGCVGILKDWLGRALSGALRAGAATVRLSDLQNTALSIKAVDKLLSECIAGENKLKETDEDRKLLRAKMKLDRENGGQRGQPNAGAHPFEVATEESAPKRRGKPFERLPRRDPIGTEVGHDGR